MPRSGQLYTYPPRAGQQRRAQRTRHADSLGKEVGGVGDQYHQAAFNVRVPADVGVLKAEGSQDANKGADGQTAKELGQEVPDTVEEAYESDGASLLTSALGRLEDDNGDSIVENRFTKNDSVQLGVNLEGVEDGQDGDRICGRQGSTNGDGVDPRHLETLERDGCIEEQEHTNDDGRDKCTGKGKG